MQILLIIVFAVVIGALSENFGGVVAGGIAGFLLDEILKLRRQIAELQRRVDGLATSAPAAARDFDRASLAKGEAPSAPMREPFQVAEATPATTQAELAS